MNAKGNIRGIQGIDANDQREIRPMKRKSFVPFEYEMGQKTIHELVFFAISEFRIKVGWWGRGKLQKGWSSIALLKT